MLTGLGWHDLANGGVGIPYKDATGETRHVKRRTALSAREGSYWPKDTPLMAYGLEDLAAARQAGHLTLVEGESDAATLRLHGYPVLGIPGADAAKTLEASHLEGIARLYVHQEPDAGGYKDPNALHQADPDGFKGAWQAALDAAEPLKPTLKTYTAPELMRQTFPEPRWAIPDIVPEGVAILAGRPKIGKSWLVLDLAIATAAGGRALGAVAVEPGEVLYAALEDRERRMQDRLRMLLDQDRPPTDLHFIHVLPRMHEGLLDAIESWLTDHPRARLLVIDTLAKIRAPRQKNTDWYAEDMALGADLQRLALAYHVALVVVHHLNKGAQEDPLDQVSGSVGLVASADAVLILRRGRGVADATLLVTGRDVVEQDLALKFKRGSWTLIGGAEEFRVSQERKAIADLLRDATEPMSPKEIARALRSAPAR